MSILRISKYWHSDNSVQTNNIQVDKNKLKCLILFGRIDFIVPIVYRDSKLLVSEGLIKYIK